MGLTNRPQTNNALSDRDFLPESLFGTKEQQIARNNAIDSLLQREAALILGNGSLDKNGGNGHDGLEGEETTSPQEP